jgi:hypothetical protein
MQPAFLPFLLLKAGSQVGLFTFHSQFSENAHPFPTLLYKRSLPLSLPIPQVTQIDLGQSQVIMSSNIYADQVIVEHLKSSLSTPR